MIGTFNCRKSWEKQRIYNLDNGWTATVEHSYYGEMVSRLDSPGNQILANGKTYWHCSDGLQHLPEFARAWLEVVVPSAGTQLVRPRFEKMY
jgi:hypothetical protein